MNKLFVTIFINTKNRNVVILVQEMKYHTKIKQQKLKIMMI